MPVNERKFTGGLFSESRMRENLTYGIDEVTVET